MERIINNTTYYAFTRDLTINENSSKDIALNTRNLYCIIEALSGRMLFTNTSGDHNVDYKELKIYSESGTEGFSINGYQLKLGLCGFRGGSFSPDLNYFSTEISNPSGESFQHDYDLSTQGFIDLITFFKELSDSKEDLINDNRRLITEKRFIKKHLTEFHNLTMSLI